MPPTITTAASTTITAPVTGSATFHSPLTLAATEFAWVILPMPNEASTPATAKNPPRKAPSGPLMPRRS